MRLVLGSRVFDLAARALVIAPLAGTGGAFALRARAARELAAAGADLVELGWEVGIGAADLRALARRSAVDLAVRVPAGPGDPPVSPGTAAAACREAGALLVAGDRAWPPEPSAGGPWSVVDAVGAGLEVVAVAVARGCRLVRTEDVGPARRVCDVLAAVAGAR